MILEICKRLGCQGIVSGMLNFDNTIDTKRTKELIVLSKPMAFTFHHAFDWTPNPFDALHTLMELKVDRILTSGQSTLAKNGILILNQLKKMAEGKLIVIPGSGINK